MSVSIKFKNWSILATSTVLGQQHDQNSQTVTVTGDIPPGWDWYLLLGLGDQYNAYLMSQEAGSLSVLLDETALPQSGPYQLQLKGIQLEDPSVIKHTNATTVLVEKSIKGDGSWAKSIGAFSQIEERIQAQAAQITQQANMVTTLAQEMEYLSVQCQEAVQSTQQNVQQTQDTLETINQQADTCQAALSQVHDHTTQAVAAKDQAESASAAAQAAATAAQDCQESAVSACTKAQAYCVDTQAARNEVVQYVHDFQSTLDNIYTKPESNRRFACALLTNTDINESQEICPDIESSLIIKTYGYCTQLGEGIATPNNIRPIITGGRQANLLNPEKFFSSPNVTYDSETGTITRSVTAGLNYDIFTGSVGLNTAVSNLSLILQLIPNHSYTVSIDSISQGSVYIRPVSNLGSIVPTSWKLNSDILSTEIITTETGYITIRLEELSVVVAGLRLSHTTAPYSPYTENEFTTYITLQGMEQYVVPLHLTEPLCEGDYVLSTEGNICVEHHSQKLLVLNGSEDWIEDTPGYVWRLPIDPASKSAICSHFTQMPIAELRNGAIGMYATNSASLFVGYPANNVDDFKSYLHSQYQNGVPVTFVYLRCTPSPYDLAPIQYTSPSIHIAVPATETGPIQLSGEHSIAVQYNQSISYAVSMLQKQLSALQAQIDLLTSEQN